MNKGTLGIHEIKLVVQTSPSFNDSSGVRQHADCTRNLGQVTIWYNSWWLVIDTNLEASGTPVNKLDRALGLDGGNGSVDVFRNNISTVQETASHVFTMTRITFYHLVSRFEASISDFSNTELLMVGLFR